MTHNNGKL